MAAIGQAAATELIAQAEEAGMTAEQIAQVVGHRSADDLPYISGAGRTRIRQAIADRREWLAAQAEVLRLNDLYPEPVDQIRAKTAQWSTARLRELSSKMDRYLRSLSIDTRPPRPPQSARPATARQIDFIMDLLERRRRSGEGGGFMSTSGLVDADGRPVRAQIAQLTMEAASNLIDSLRGEY